MGQCLVKHRLVEETRRLKTEKQRIQTEKQRIQKKIIDLRRELEQLRSEQASQASSRSGRQICLPPRWLDVLYRPTEFGLDPSQFDDIFQQILHEVYQGNQVDHADLPPSYETQEKEYEAGLPSYQDVLNGSNQY